MYSVHKQYMYEIHKVKCSRQSPISQAFDQRDLLIYGGGRSGAGRSSLPLNASTLMPYVNFKLTPEGLTPAKKARLIEAVTTLLEEELGKNPETTIVVIDEIATDNWGIAGKTVTERRSGG